MCEARLGWHVHAPALPLILSALLLCGCVKEPPKQQYTRPLYCAPGQTGRCVECKHQVLCSRYGLCAFKGPYQCTAGSDAECKQSKTCRRNGKCTKIYGRCDIESDDDCKRSRLCERKGRCTAGKPYPWSVECVACRDTDCQQSRDCKRKGKCFAQGLRCVAKRNATQTGPPKACIPKPAPPTPVSAPKPLGQARLEVRLKKGLAPCVLRFVGSITEQSDGFGIFGVSRIEVEESQHCAADVLLDSKQGGSLVGGGLPKLDTVVDRRSGTAERWMLHDLDFDGYLDLAIHHHMRSGHSDFRHWVYRPKTRKLVPIPTLDALWSPRFDATTRTVSSARRVSPRVYMVQKHRWFSGKLEVVFKEIRYNGQAPNGQPLPAGHVHTTRWERKLGVLVKTFDAVVVISLKP